MAKVVFGYSFKIGKVMDDVIWKNVPDHSLYRVSDRGELRKMNADGEWVAARTFESPTSVGTYINSAVYSDDGVRTTRGVHYLVCLAFNGAPPNDGKRYEVNHIDGNKHNNVPENLEWSTRSENMFHALKSGLRKDNLEIDVTDISTGKTDKYYSLSELSRAWNIPRYGIRTLIARHNEVPYQGRWLFNIVKERLGKINRPHHCNVISKNYVTGQVLVTNDAAEMEYYTKVKSVNIVNRVGNVPGKIKNLDGMLAGYVFRKVTDTSPWPEYTVEEALASRNEYFNKVIRPFNKPYLVKNYVDGSVKEYPTLVKMAKDTGVSASGLMYRLNQNKNLKLLKGFVFVEKGFDQIWPEFSEEEIKKSLLERRPPSRPNTTSLASGLT